MVRKYLWCCVACGVVLSAGCVIFQPEDSSYDPKIDPADFVKTIDNPYFPLKVGTKLRYRSATDEGLEDIEVTVTPETRSIIGVTCTVVHDVSSKDGRIIEDTYDWYAQDREGSVWYFGEDTKEYDGGQVSTEGSWEAGVHGGKPGLVMPAHPTYGQSFRQEYLFGEAEDEGQILSLDESVTVVAGTFNHCIKTKEWSRLEPAIVEHKYYAKGVGVVLEVVAEGGTEREELVSR